MLKQNPRSRPWSSSHGSGLPVRSDTGCFRIPSSRCWFRWGAHLRSPALQTTADGNRISSKRPDEVTIWHLVARYNRLTSTHHPTRYFQGVQGDTSKQGELFGLKNIFKLHEDTLATKMAVCLVLCSSDSVLDTTFPDWESHLGRARLGISKYGWFKGEETG